MFDENVCSAFNSNYKSTSRAMAACIEQELEQYQYSSEFVEETAEYTCPEGFLLTGCTCYSEFQQCSGTKFDGNTCKVYNSKDEYHSTLEANCIKMEGSVHTYASKYTADDEQVAEISCYEG